jgi:hypothetical protein
MFRIILILILLPVTCFSQNFIGKSKDAVMKELQGQIQPDDSLSKKLSQNDSLILLTINAGTSRYTDFYYGFDKSGKCKLEKIKSGCESCFNNLLDKILEQKMIEWKQINGNQYVSKFSDHLLLEIQIESEKKNFSITILRTDWNRELYNMITGN